MNQQLGSSPKAIFFSNQLASKQGHGIARFALHLVRAMRSLDDPPVIVPVSAWSDLSKAELKKRKEDLGLRLLPTGRLLTPALWTTLRFPRIEHLVNQDIDIVHANSIGYPVSTSLPYIVTVHDIGPVSHPQYYTSRARRIFNQGLVHALRTAALFHCVSKSTAATLEAYAREMHGLDLADRLIVVHEGVSNFFLVPRAEIAQVVFDGKQMPEGPFILAVGKISPRKNLESILRALYQIKEKVPHHLVTVGGTGWDYESAFRLVKELDLEHRVHFLGYVSDEQLRFLYHQAEAYVYPSMFEGFGLTVLEAMACGCPVITSNVSSLPEVAGDAALLVDPSDVRQLANAMLAICTDAALAEAYAIRGTARAKMFSWQTCAEEMAEIYRELCAG